MHSELLCIKILVLGESGIGKSCLAKRYTKEAFSMDFITTMGVDFMVKTIQASKDRRVKLQIWDTAGQERFTKLVDQYFRGASGGLVCFDRSNAKSFEAVKKWVSKCRDYTSDLPILLVETKIDSNTEEDQLWVSKSEINQLCTELNCDYARTSAKTGEGVEEAFKMLVEMMLANLEQGGRAGQSILQKNDSFNVVFDQVESPARIKKCCF